ncbi:MAG: hypothetical protein ACRDBG_28475 [Waterburya sp.]
MTKTLYFATLEYDCVSHTYSIPAIKQFECYLDNGGWKLCPHIVGDTFDNVGTNSILEEDLDTPKWYKSGYVGYSYTEQGAKNLIEITLLKLKLNDKNKSLLDLKAKMRTYQGIKSAINESVANMLVAMEDIVDFDFDDAKKNVAVYDAMIAAMNTISDEMDQKLPTVLGSKGHNLKKLPN